MSSQRRCLLQALAVSLAAHGLLLLSVLAPFQARLEAPATAIQAVLNSPGREKEQERLLQRPGSEGKARASVEQPKSLPSAPPVVPEKTVTRTEVSSPASSSPLAVAEPAATSAIVPSSTRPVVRESGASGGALSSASSAASENSLPRAGSFAGAASAGARDGVSADDLRSYRMSLAAAARRFKRYPALARERGWEGTAEVALEVRAQLPVPAVALVKSSGYDLLDEQAVAMMTQAAGAISLPESMKGRDFRIVLPVKFGLNND